MLGVPYHVAPKFSFATARTHAYRLTTVLHVGAEHSMGKKRQVRKFGEVKRLLNPKDNRMYVDFAIG